MTNLDHSRKSVATELAPAAIGPYAQGIAAGGFLYVSGQLPLNPRSGEFVPGGIAELTRQCLANLAAVAAAGGSGLDRAVKITVFMTDLKDFTQMNQIYAEFFPTDPPARSAVQVAALPKGAAIEVEGIFKL